MVILHALHIRSLQDLRTADENLLAKHLTMMEIKALKRRSAASISTPKNHSLLSAANLPLRAVQVLNAMGVTKIANLAEVSEADLRAEPKLGKTEMLAILRDAVEKAGMRLVHTVDPKIHDRLLHSEQWLYLKVGRGLDIYKPVGGLAARDPSLRQVRPCDIDSLRSRVDVMSCPSSRGRSDAILYHPTGANHREGNRSIHLRRSFANTRVVLARFTARSSLARIAEYTADRLRPTSSVTSLMR